MLIFSETGFADVAAAKLEVARIRAMADDLERLIDGTPPSEVDLARTPFIDRWSLIGKPLPALSGIAINPPTGQQPIAPWETPPIAVVAESLGWVRCADRFYRLRQIEEGQHFAWDLPSMQQEEHA